ncbi:hypothetical protein BS47DRAFT_1391399 [Hydnum rufescens UP504]|uniref:Beta-lactamase-related domain-containing protein n=1 Tax=Hydnum rufescens UP504 TaxID=1448309 RepID=A0A9P6B1J6_9AGAM|nr:hypothetical protein BS47DRAFT_1391399 [Hydnum rufescens UP504]
MAEKVIQKFFDDAVAQGLAPGFQFVVFDKDSLIASGASGVVDVGSATAFRKDHLLWLASCSKISISIMVLRILEKGLCPNGMTLADLDNHEKLVQVLPEFRRGSDSPVSKIIIGYEKELDPDGKKVPILRDYEGKVTLRMLLTHTSGLAYYWNHPFMVEMYQPTDGTPPLKQFPFATGLIEDFSCPLVQEPGTGYIYGASADWVGQFIIRCTGINLRQAFKKYIFEPLEIPSSELDLYIPPEHAARRAAMHAQSPTGSGFISIPFDIYMSEGDPAEGYAYFASGPLFGTIEAYTKVLQAALRHDPRILAETTWQLAVRDALTEQGIKLKPRKTIAPLSLSTLPFPPGQIFKSTVPGEEFASQTVSGRPPGSYGWCGLPSVWYAIDEATGKGYMLGTQLLVPFSDSPLMDLKDEFEKLVWSTIKTPGGGDLGGLDKKLGAT